jgi:hypothetical protein
MHAISLPKTLAVAVVVGVTSLASAAHAQAPGSPPGPLPAPSPTMGPQAPAPPPPAPGSFQAPQGAYAAPPSYPMSPGMYYPPYAPYAPPAYGSSGGETWKRKSKAMIGVGAALFSAGTLAAVLGSAFYSIGGKTQYCYYEDFGGFSDCDSVRDKSLRDGGIAMIALGALSVAVGLPVFLVGFRKVAKDPAPASGTSLLLPKVDFGTQGGSLTWQF